ncbi:unnamed protein product [Paramecium sonneborni]|uniref:Uncharacterized protein n=1 Tax=Paramecium sonneborni TaxID=65129 RepID=A0A8S1R430_9CILI|nr:unnamed protein product [Paramecium sonneborni]
MNSKINCTAKKNNDKSVPQFKEGINKHENDHLDIRISILCELKSYEAEEQGFNTAKENYLKIYSTIRKMQNPNFQEESRNKNKLFITCIQVMTIVDPPELPMILSISVNKSLTLLQLLKIFCKETFRIPLTGKEEVLNFDKIGTITNDTLLFTEIVDNCFFNKQSLLFLNLTNITLMYTFIKKVKNLIDYQLKVLEALQQLFQEIPNEKECCQQHYLGYNYYVSQIEN